MTSGAQSGWLSYSLDLPKAGTMLREYAVGCEGDPLMATLYRDRRHRDRCIVARYAGGWTLRLNFNVKGDVTSASLGRPKTRVRK